MSEINGMKSAVNALRYWEVRQEAVANNLANVSTDGFKGERVFARMLGDAVPFAEAATDFTPGTLRPTGSPLDLALEGEGFFVVEGPGGERLSRGGAFHLTEDGLIADSSGNLLLGEGGPISLPPGTIEVDRSGAVKVDGEVVGQLRIERVPPGVRLQHDAGTLFLPHPSREPMDADARPVRQGTVEESNVGSVESLVDMITIQRSYMAVQRAVQTLDGIRGTITSELARPV